MNMVGTYKKYKAKRKLKKQLRRQLKSKQQSLNTMVENKHTYDGKLFYAEVYFPMVQQINNLKSKLEDL